MRKGRGGKGQWEGTRIGGGGTGGNSKGMDLKCIHTKSYTGQHNIRPLLQVYRLTRTTFSFHC